jgi:hypothetical protein
LSIENKISGLEDKISELDHSDKVKEKSKSMKGICKISGAPLKDQTYESRA